MILPPGYNGAVPEGGFYVARSKSTRVLILGRQFLEKDDPKPAVEGVKRNLKIYPYTPGGEGNSIAQILDGTVKPERPDAIQPTVFVNWSGKAFNTIPPSDYTFFEMLNDLVQQEPIGGMDVERMGQLAAIGIVKGKPFQPDARMKRILTEAAQVGQATSRTLVYRPRDAEGFRLYPNSMWYNPLWIGGYTMETPPALGDCEGCGTDSPDGRPDAGCTDCHVLLCHRHYACDDHAAAECRVTVPDGLLRQRRARPRW